GIGAGQVTVTFRRWRRLQVKVGGRYRTGGDGGRSMIGADGTRAAYADLIEVDAVDRVAESRLTAADARAAGYPTVVALRADLPKATGLPLYRIRFHLVDAPDPRAVLAADTDVDVAALDARLDRMDSYADAPWTAATLRAIAARPGVVSTELAAPLGRERFDFKRDVAKLKRLGLTISLPVGYRLSPRGEAYLRQTARR
ncbi:MAG: hypothetical protein ACRDTM_11565, partial [Micromonosporaceae bacterium]